MKTINLEQYQEMGKRNPINFNDKTRVSSLLEERIDKIKRDARNIKAISKIHLQGLKTYMNKKSFKHINRSIEESLQESNYNKDYFYDFDTITEYNNN